MHKLPERGAISVKRQWSVYQKENEAPEALPSFRGSELSAKISQKLMKNSSQNEVKDPLNESKVGNRRPDSAQISKVNLLVDLGDENGNLLTSNRMKMQALIKKIGWVYEEQKGIDERQGNQF